MTKEATASITKPYPEYPLTYHKHAKQWCKKIKGKIYYFGHDQDTALARYLHDRDYLLAGKHPPTDNSDGRTVADVANHFMTSRQRLVDSGELKPLSFQGYYAACKMMVDCFGRTRPANTLGPQDFAKLRTHLTNGVGLVTLKNRIRRLMVLFNYATKNRLIDKIHFGSEFTPPTQNALRIYKAKKAKRLFTAEAIRQILDRCSTVDMKAIVLLGINCGLGNNDISEMQINHVDLDGGWLNYPRIKTGVDRRCKLWPETIAALRTVLARRRQPKSSADTNTLFVTRKTRTRYVYTVTIGEIKDAKISTRDAISSAFRRILTTLNIRQQGVNFYALRHTFRTTADNLVGDQRAIDIYMGHLRNDISEVYVHTVNDERLANVASAVHDWLFPPKKAEASHG